MKKLLERLRQDVNSPRKGEWLSDFEERKELQSVQLALLEAVQLQPCFYYASAWKDMQFVHAVATCKLPSVGWFLHTDYRYFGGRSHNGPLQKWCTALLRGETVKIRSGRQEAPSAELLSLVPFILKTEVERSVLREQFLKEFFNEGEYTLENEPDFWLGQVYCAGKKYPIVFSQIENSAMMDTLLKFKVSIATVCSYVSGESGGGNRLPFTEGAGQENMLRFLTKTNATWIDNNDADWARLRVRVLKARKIHEVEPIPYRVEGA
jgi:hypothetical protein